MRRCEADREYRALAVVDFLIRRPIVLPGIALVSCVRSIIVVH